MAGASILAHSGLANAADTWPSRPISIVVAYPPGGATDAVARLLAKSLADQLTVAVYVDNRGGAGGRTGTKYVASANPDGNILLFGSGAELTGAPATVKEMPYDPLKDLAPIIRVADGPYLLLANPSFPPNNVRELLACARERPGQVNFSSGGPYSASHLCLMQINDRVGIPSTHIPYRGAGPSLVALVANEVNYSVNTPNAALDLIAAGKLKVLAVCSETRLDKLPKVPTLIEQGYPGLVGGSWYGLLAPRGTPAPVIERLNKASQQFLQSPATRKFLDSVYIKPVGGTPAELHSYMQSEILRYKDLMTRLKLQPE